MVADKFTEKVNQERKDQGSNQVTITTDDKAKQELAGRPVETMYFFEHEKPSGMRPGEDYWIDREPGEEEMGFATENIAISTISKSKVDGDPDKLADLIAEAMFNQFIEKERDAALNGGPGESGHYENIIMTDHENIIVAVYVVDMGSYYMVSSVVCTGNTY